MTKHFCDICKQPALESLKVELVSTHGEITVVAKVVFQLAPIVNHSPEPDLCDRCLATILEDLHKKYTAAG